MRTLIIDDDADLRNLLERYIMQQWPDGQVEQYDPLDRDIPDASFPLGSYDVLILDYMLGRGDGLQWLQEFKRRADCPPVLFLTGAGNEIVAVRAMKAGADDYQRKQELTREKLITSLRDLTAHLSERTLSPELAARMEGQSLGARMQIPGIKVLHLIGEGGMSRVYLASREGDDEPLVVKILRSEVMSDRNALARFMEEYALVERIQSRYAALHEPRAGARPGARPAHRHLQRRGAAVPDADRPAPFRRSDCGRGGPAPSEYTAAGPAGGPSPVPAAARQAGGEGPRRALSQRRRGDRFPVAPVLPGCRGDGGRQDPEAAALRQLRPDRAQLLRQVLGRERLGDRPGGAHRYQLVQVALRSLGGDEHHRQRPGLRPQLHLAEQGRAVQRRHHPVEHHQVRAESGHRLDRQGRVADDLDRHLADPLERHAHDALDVLVVLDVADAGQRSVRHQGSFLGCLGSSNQNVVPPPARSSKPMRPCISSIIRLRSAYTSRPGSSPRASKRTLKRSPKPSLSTIASRTRPSMASTSGVMLSLPDSIFSMSRMSLMMSSRRWPLRSATSVSSLTSFESSPATPELSSCSAPMIEVSGVRSSWLSVEVNSFFMRSASVCRVMSLPWAMTETMSPSGLTSGVTVHSHTSAMPSRRGLRISRPASGSRVSLIRLQWPSNSAWNSGSTRRLTCPPISSAAAYPNRSSAAWLTALTMPWGSISRTAIGARSANSASFRPLASTWRRASSSSTSCSSSRWFSTL